MQDTSTESERINDATSQLYRTFSKQTRPQQAFSQLFPFAVYQFPLSLRHFIPNDYAQRFKVRGGILFPFNGVIGGSTYGPVAGTDGATQPNAGIYLSTSTTQIPPDDSTKISATWNEVVVPMDSNTHYFWISQCLHSNGGTEVSSTGLVYGTVNTSGLSMQSGNTVNDLWPSFPQNDPYHTLVASINGTPGVGYTIEQFVFDHQPLWRNSPDNSGQGMNPMFWRGQYSASKYYFVGDMVQVGTIGSTNPLDEYIYWPTALSTAYPIAIGPIHGVAPTYPPTDPWVLWCTGTQR